MTKKLTILDYAAIADIHAQRLVSALDYVSTWIPVTPDGLRTMPIDKLAFLDMMAIRFKKLQDVIGAKIFALLLDLLGEDALSLIDKLNRLERLGYIDDASWWMGLRELRNLVMHDYPDDYEVLCEHLVLLQRKSNELIRYWSKLKTQINTLTL